MWDSFHSLIWLWDKCSCVTFVLLSKRSYNLFLFIMNAFTFFFRIRIQPNLSTLLIRFNQDKRDFCLTHDSIWMHFVSRGRRDDWNLIIFYAFDTPTTTWLPASSSSCCLHCLPIKLVNQQKGLHGVWQEGRSRVDK